jgi:glyoxylase-like metal-dependent hydrolase (beta-lactamase superfamily II)
MCIHHLNCGSMSPFFPRVEAVTYCLLVETNGGLVLVDTGFGLQDYARPTPLMRLFTWLLGVPRDVKETAVRQVVGLGFGVEDVRHIVLTHLHLDHSGGLADFPQAEVHVSRPEFEAAMDPRGLMERAYVSAHWAHGPRWVIHEWVGGRWFGFESMRILEGLTPEMRLILLPGHTRGHCGVAVRTGEGWLLHCGDAASPFHRQGDPLRPHDVARPMDGWPDWLVRRVIGPHVPRLRELVREHGDEVRLISAHDVYGFRRYGVAGQTGCVAAVGADRSRGAGRLPGRRSGGA